MPDYYLTICGEKILINTSGQPILSETDPPHEDCCACCPSCCDQVDQVVEHTSGGVSLPFGGSGFPTFKCIAGLDCDCNCGGGTGITLPTAVLDALCPQDPVGNPEDPCHTETRLFEYAAFCQDAPEFDSLTWRFVWAIYVEDPENPGTYICCGCNNSCSANCETIGDFTFEADGTVTIPFCDGFFMNVPGLCA